MFKSLLSTALRALVLAVGVVILAGSLCLLSVRETQQGLVFALAGIAFGVTAVVAGLNWVRRKMLVWQICFGIVALGVGLTFWLILKAPDGRTSSTARVQNRYSDGDWHFSRLALGNLLPEVDQFRLGFQLVPFIDRLFTRKQATALNKLTTSLYRDLEKDPDFHALGSVLPEAYDEIWGLSFESGHYFLCTPKNLDKTKPAPVLVFLHGSGGNFKAYTWLLSQLADELDVVVIAPSYGMGDWKQKDTARVIRTALDDAAKVVSLDRQQVHLMGLSNGGRGVSQAAVDLGPQLRSLTFLSPVFDLRMVGSQEMATQWKGRPVLVISGAQDDRVPLDTVNSAAETLLRDEINVSMKTAEGADHFMLFSHWKEVSRLIVNWLKPQLPTPAS